MPVSEKDSIKEKMYFFEMSFGQKRKWINEIIVNLRT